jgi:hypothetical protein
MKKFLKISAVVLLLLVVGLAGAALFVWRGVKAVPDFYSSQPLEGQARLEAIESVERKVLNLQSVLDRAYVRAQTGAADDPAPDTATSQPAEQILGKSSDEPISVAFTGPELDTYFRKWLQETGYAPRLAKYMNNPRIGIDDGRVILAGQMAEFDAVVSLYFLPEVDDEGAVHLKLDGIYAGRIPLPDMAFETFREQAIAALSEGTAQLRSEADISAEGFANESAILLTSQQQLRELFDGREVEPMIAFLPLPARGFVPARVSELSIEEQELVLGVQLLSRGEQAELLEMLRQGEP